MTLASEVAEQLRRLDDDENSTSLTLRDQNLAALMLALEERGELAALGEAVSESLGRETSPATRAGVLGYLIRVGLRESAPEVWDDAAAGYEEYLLSQADEF